MAAAVSDVTDIVATARSGTGLRALADRPSRSGT
jgi:hypothetical protein